MYTSGYHHPEEHVPPWKTDTMIEDESNDSNQPKQKVAVEIHGKRNHSRFLCTNFKQAKKRHQQGHGQDDNR